MTACPNPKKVLVADSGPSCRVAQIPTKSRWRIRGARVGLPRSQQSAARKFGAFAPAPEFQCGPKSVVMVVRPPPLPSMSMLTDTCVVVRTPLSRTHSHPKSLRNSQHGTERKLGTHTRQQPLHQHCNMGCRGGTERTPGTHTHTHTPTTFASTLKYRVGRVAQSER